MIKLNNNKTSEKISKENNSGSGQSRLSMKRLIWRQFKKNKGAMIGLFVITVIILVSLVSPLIWDYETDITGMDGSQRQLFPSSQHWFGTDTMGRDIFARVCYGARYSLLIGVVSVGISLLIGTTVGAIAGYYGGLIEAIIMFIVELFLMIPSILLTIVFVAVLGINLQNLMIALGLVTVPYFARNARASVMMVCGNEYVEAAKAMGANNLTILFTHVLPNALSPILVQATTRVGSVIVSAASFSFLGLGVPMPTPEWGAMLSDARQFMRDYPYQIMFPGIAIMITVLAINLVGDGLRDALDPKLKR